MGGNDAPAIAVDDLSYRWPRQTRDCLVIPHLAVAPGERVFLHGPSGSGKSTLLGLLAGVLVARQGRVRVLGQDLAAMAGRHRDGFRVDHIGILFQQFNLIPYLSVIDNVVLPCRFSARRRQRCAEGMHDEARRLLGHLQIADECHAHPACELSVGQQQRVAAARALIGRPEIVIADEPTSALDAGRQRAFLDLLAAECAASGAALLFVSHDVRLAERFDRSVALADVNAAEEGA